MKYTLPPLGYGFNALEPYIDAQTVEIHYTKHHQTYLNNLNALLEKHSALGEKTLEKLLPELKTKELGADFAPFVNNAGGFLNHNLYWATMGPKKEIDEAIVSDVKKEFGSVDEFKKILTEAAMKRFGSGWAWLARDEAGKLTVFSTPNQESPLMQGFTPLLGIDVWEHAYYLKYQNRRAEYIEAWWKAVKVI